MRRPQFGDLGGAFGDLGTLLPLAAGLVIVSGLDARGFSSPSGSQRSRGVRVPPPDAGPAAEGRGGGGDL